MRGVLFVLNFLVKHEANSPARLIEEEVGFPPVMLAVLDAGHTWVYWGYRVRILR